MALRKWQEEALEIYRFKNPKCFNLSATPGSGKTTFSFALIEKLISVKQINQIIIVVPTDHLRTQWANNGIERNIFLDPSLSNRTALLGDDFMGYIVTYAQVASNPGIHMRRATQVGKKTLVVFDEIHHAADSENSSWGEAIKTAFGEVSRVLSLTGTPFRTSNDETIPFLKYQDADHGTKISVSDYSYGYKEALADKVVRPVTFAAYSGQAKWSNSAGEIFEASLLGDELSKSNEQAAWKTSLSPQGNWIPHVISAADDRLSYLRQNGMNDAGAMMLASDQKDAKAYAKVIEKVTGNVPTVILSDDNKASQKIDAFSQSKDEKDRWLVAVRMVSEGVDVPRLAVGIWATNYRTPLFFAQAVGRFIRSRQPGEVATVFLPAVKPLLALAASMEEERQHVIAAPKDNDDLGEVTVKEEKEKDEEKNRTIFLDASAEFAHVLHGGQAHVGNVDVDYLGLPGLLEPDQIADLLRKRDFELRKNVAHVKIDEKVFNPLLSAEVRKDINRLVSRIALKKNIPHAKIHIMARQSVPGLPTSQADYETLLKRRQYLEENS